jgi:hypothetical protein
MDTSCRSTKIARANVSYRDTESAKTDISIRSIELAIKRSQTDFEHAKDDSNHQDHGVARDTPLKRNDQLSTLNATPESRALHERPGGIYIMHTLLSALPWRSGSKVIQKN